MDIVLHTDIAAAALHAHEEYAYRDWLLLRNAGQGQGHCRTERFHAWLARNGYAPTTIEEIVKRLTESGFAERRLAAGEHEVLKPLPLPEVIDRFRIGKSTRRVAVDISVLKGKGLRRR